MPVAAEILHADMQHGTVYVWALVDPDAPSTVDRRLGYFGTGHKEIPLTARHIGTCINRDFNLVWHVFEDTATRGGDASDADAESEVRTEVGPDVAEAASGGAGAASLASSAVGARLHGVHHFERLRRTFGFDYWDEPGLREAS
jgi:hypothetical protein